MEAVVTIHRTALALSPLNIYESCGETDNNAFWLTMNGLARPNFGIRLQHVPDSAWVSGRKLLIAEPEPTSLTLDFIISGSSHGDLSAKMSELEQATEQFSYTVSLDIDGQTKTWDADSTLPQWGKVEYLLQYLMKVRGHLEIPIYP